jgi:hypothetical protein
MDNGLNLDVVLTLPGADEATCNRTSALLAEKSGGARNARKAVVVGAGYGDSAKATLETLGTAPKDMDYPDGWEQMTKFALALFGVPPAVAGLTPTGGNAELFAARRQFLDQQSGLVGEVGDFYTRSLADPYSSFPGEYVVQVKPQPVDDHEFREQQLERRLKYDLVSYNEARAMDDADPVPGGDVPVSAYLKKLDGQVNPAPEPQPGAPPGAGGKPPALPGATPTGGAPPGEDNPAAEGTRPPGVKPVAKSADAMNTLSLSEGGALVPDGTAATSAKRRKKRKASDPLVRCIRQTFKAL